MTTTAICFALGDKVSNLRVDSPESLFNEGILHHSGRSMSVKLEFSLKNGSNKTVAEILTTQTKTKKVIMLNGQINCCTLVVVANALPKLTQAHKFHVRVQYKHHPPPQSPTTTATGSTISAKIFARSEREIHHSRLRYPLPLRA